MSNLPPCRYGKLASRLISLHTVSKFNSTKFIQDFFRQQPNPLALATQILGHDFSPIEDKLLELFDETYPFERLYDLPPSHIQYLQTLTYREQTRKCREYDLSLNDMKMIIEGNTRGKSHRIATENEVDEFMRRHDDLYHFVDWSESTTKTLILRRRFDGVELKSEPFDILDGFIPSYRESFILDFVKKGVDRKKRSPHKEEIAKKVFSPENLLRRMNLMMEDLVKNGDSKEEAERKVLSMDLHEKL